MHWGAYYNLGPNKRSHKMRYYDILALSARACPLEIYRKVTDRMAKRTHVVKFDAHKIEKAPVKFTTSDGEKVSFNAKQEVVVPVKFRAKN